MPSGSLLAQVIPDKNKFIVICVDFNSSYFRLIKLNLNQVMIFLNVYGLTQLFILFQFNTSALSSSSTNGQPGKYPMKIHIHIHN